VDDPAALLRILGALHEIATEIPVIFSCHPRTAVRMKSLESYDKLAGKGELHVLPPLGYLDFLHLLSNARLVLTDSGGLQEETTYLGIHCVTIRENTERPVTMTQGTNVLAGTDPAKILAAARPALDGRPARRGALEHWDGKTAPRIVDVFQSWWNAR
jgi:UDP-N-acetylglucosamine 2-epimerase (non-hydrolysing)